MRTITEDEAKFLREIRVGFADAIRSIQDRVSAVRLKCGHDEHDENCPLCCIYAEAEPESYLTSVLPEFAAAIDSHLLRGPAPV